MLTEVSSLPISRERRGSAAYYRPELDLVRFIAFAAVFFCHGPRFVAFPSSLGSKWLDSFQSSGAYGVCLFFLLSSYLITELLLREREKTGSIHLKAFYIRRILRIWPLYYLGVAIAIAFSLYRPLECGLTRANVAELALFVGWLGGMFHHNPMGVLWSVSVEEMFYLVWPAIARIKGERSILLASVLIVPTSVVATFFLSSTWFNPLVHFLFFATGGLLAIVLHKRTYRLKLILRPILFAAGLLAWTVVVPYLEYPGSYLIIDAGCVLLFLSMFGMPPNYLPSVLVYLGRISYGLYVFHSACLMLIAWVVIPHLPGASHRRVAMVETYALSLATTIVLAALSYRFFEMPFLRIKKRFELVRSRD